MNHTKEEYLEMMKVAPIWGFPTETEKSYKIKLVKIRNPRTCTGCSQDKWYTPGTYMLCESAIVEEEGWRSAYTCTTCLDNWMEEIKKYG